MSVLDVLGLLLGCWRTTAPRTLEQPLYTAPYGSWPV